MTKAAVVVACRLRLGPTQRRGATTVQGAHVPPISCVHLIKGGATSRGRKFDDLPIARFWPTTIRREPHEAGH